MRATGVGWGQRLLALDTTVVSRVEAPRGLDLPVASAALIDSDDVRLGLGRGADSADVFFLLGVADQQGQHWLDKLACGPADRAPVAIFAKNPSDALAARAVAAGTAVVAVDPQARWERLYRLVDHVLEHHLPSLGDPTDPRNESGTDLFGLAQSLADRIHGMVSIEDEQSHVLAYSASNDEADELRRLSILGRTARVSEVDRPMGDLHCTAGQRRRGRGRRASGVGSAAPVGRWYSSPGPGCSPGAGLRRNHLGATRLAAVRGRRRGSAARS